jgi:DNA modification methylase
VILQGDCLEVLRTLDAGIAQTCVTSPPYWGLRDYGVEGQLGLERTPEEYAAKMVAIFREVRRVLRDDGTLWLNLGDSYSGSNSDANSIKNPNSISAGMGQGKGYIAKGKGVVDGLKPKDLCGIPWMIAFALRADGWYLRQDIIWDKPNPMPESVTDRCTKSHEYIFLLSKRAKYYYDNEAVREDGPTYIRKAGGYEGRKPSDGGPGHAIYDENCTFAKRDVITNGRNRRSVWRVATAPYAEAHFATYPPKLIEPCILAGTSERGQCPKCGKPWERVVESSGGNSSDEAGIAAMEAKGVPRTSANLYVTKERGTTTTLGWQTTCKCDAGEPIPQIVLDPFFGAGTTGLVASQHLRRYIGIELNETYCEMARKRIEQDAPLFAEAS